MAKSPVKFGENIGIGEDIRPGHNNDPDIVDELIKDVKGAGRGLIRGLTTDLIGAPSDILSIALRAAGVDVPDENVLGSQHLRRLTGQPKIDTPPETFGNIVSTAINPSTTIVKGAALFGILARPTEKSAKLAQVLFGKGIPESKIYKETRVSISPIGTMRREIPDQKSHLTSKATTFIKSNQIHAEVYPNAEAFLKHNNLYNDSVLGKRLKQTRIRISKSGKDNDNVSGSWDFDNDSIHIKTGNKATQDDIVAVTLHEMQHKVQDLQGLERGANSGDILDRLNSGKLTPSEHTAAVRIQGSNLEFENEDIADIIYWSMAGEVEARAVQKRYLLPKDLVDSINPVFDRPLSKILDRGEELQFDKANGINNSIALRGNVK